MKELPYSIEDFKPLFVKQDYENRLERQHRQYFVEPTLEDIPKREYHIPFHNYAGPGTHLTERIERGDKPVSVLDAAAMIHDVDYLSGDQAKADSTMLSNLTKGGFLSTGPLSVLPAKLAFSLKDAVGYQQEYNPQLANTLAQQILEKQLLKGYEYMEFSSSH